MKFVKIALMSALALLFAACASTGPALDQAPENVSGKTFDYKIGVGDQLSINVWRNPELSLVVPVRPDGMISMPLVGDVQAAGFTASELSAHLQDKLVHFIRNPQVTTIVNEASSSDYQRRVRVTGAVATPLSIPHRDGMTVLDLVLEAGGLTEFAVPNKATLVRKTANGTKTYVIRLGDILNKGDLRTNYPLAPNDVVTIPERSF